MRTLSATALEAIFAQETDTAFALLLQLDNDLLSTGPIRLARNNASIYHTACSSDGAVQLFVPAPFTITLPQERENEPPTSALSIGNVDRQIVEGIRTITTPVDVTLHVILSTEEAAVEAGPWVFTMREVTYDAFVVSGTLKFEDWLNEPSPAQAFTPTTTPGLFKGV
jgi:hypothetical protein